MSYCLIAINASKIINIVLFHELVQMMLEAFYRFNIAICCKSTKSKSMKITDEELKPSRTYLKIDTFRGEQNTKEGLVSP